MDQLLTFSEYSPIVAADVYLAAGSLLVGQVRVREGSSIWFNCVLRGDINHVHIGRGTNIQDLSVCHVADDWPCEVGDFVTVGHRAILHGCQVGDEVLIGMGAILMNGVVVGAQSIVGAGALLTEGLQVPPGSLVYGAPAKVVSQLAPFERSQIRQWAEKYQQMATAYRPRQD